MLISPKTAIEQGWISHVKYSSMEDYIKNDHLSPNAFDFTVDTLHIVNKDKPFIITNSRKTMRETSFVSPEELVYQNYSSGINGWWLLPDQAYDAASDFYVDIPEGIAALLVIRSTLSRNALIMVNGIFDSGFKGHLGTTIHTKHGSAPGFLQQGVRIGQVAFYESDKGGLYKGGYNTELNQHWTGTLKNEEPSS